MKVPIAVIGPDFGDVGERLGRRGHSVVVVRECDELAELIAACQSGAARVAVVAGGTADVTMTLVDRLLAVGVGIVCLTDDDGERRRLDGLGAFAASVDVPAEGFEELVAAAADHATGPDAMRASSFSFVGALPAATAVGRPRSEVQSRAAHGEGTGEEPSEPRGRIMAFWGPVGSPGRTTLAVNAAAELVAQNRKVFLIDADTYGPSVAPHLGLLDESAGLAQACRVADQGQLDSQALDRLAVPVVTQGGELRVLTGITRADRWNELRAASLSAVLDAARRTADDVVVDVGFCVEADEELSFDTMAPRRNAATLRVLEMADRLVAVGSADAIGMPRLVRSIDELAAAVPSANPDIVFNKVRRSALGRFPDRALRDAWERFGPARPIVGLVPFEEETVDAALLSGQTLLEAAPQSPVRRAIADLVCSPVQRKRRFAVPSARAGVRRPR
ncbi:AAA family ATPase [Sinomonas terrae]|uniref:Chromosome partitioning protein n=1 Tax=Sinomonas terrae TaxID=2908838 RepID=A0ABS9TYZ0_9MICC|nr:chromosome partitioning protein [Sinomonas terrae]MCH6469649.1 chromosome partitioning protein [Sinomonas terrae]